MPTAKTNLVPVLLALLACSLAGCGGEEGAAAATTGRPGRSEMATPVTIAKAVQRDVPVQAEVIGSVEASSAVVLKQQISGQIVQAFFREGDFVKQGQVMLTIDPRAVEAQLSQLQAQNLRDKAALGQAQANLARDRAQEENARGQLERASELSNGGIISKEQYDQYLTTVAMYAATTQADLAAIENSKAQIEASQAAVENQKVQLGYTRIFAPISGRTGTLTVKPGDAAAWRFTKTRWIRARARST
jgi:membrane fusion protein, multidrug efflux system